jgi:hypothetical protein
MYRSKSSEVALFSLKVMGELAKTKNNRIKMLEAQPRRCWRE